MRAIATDHRDVAARPDASFDEAAIDAHRHHFVGEEDCRCSVGHGENALRHCIAARLVRRGADDEAGIEGDATGGKRVTVAVDQHVTEIDVVSVRHDCDASMAFFRQPVHGRLGHALEVKIVPGMAPVGEAAAECDEGDMPIRQQVDAGVVALRGRDDDTVGKAATHDAMQILVRVLLRTAKQCHKIELVARQHGLHAVENAEEEGIAIGAGGGGASLHHEADNAGRTLAQRSAGLVRHVAELGRRGEHAFPRLFVDVGLAVEGARHRTDRDIEMVGEPADSLHGASSASLGPRWRYPVGPGLPTHIPVPSRWAIDTDLCPNIAS